MKIQNYIERERQILAQKENHLDALEGLLLQYPDIEIVHDHFNKQYYVSKLVIPDALSIEIKDACYCCRNSQVNAYRYLIAGDIKLYAAPLQYPIGENKTYAYGIQPLYDNISSASDQFTKFPEVIQQEILAYLKKHPLEYEEDEGESHDNIS